jgi:hypothetical protein
MLIVVIGFLSLIFTYFVLRPFLRTKSQRISPLGLFLIIFPLVIVAYWVFTYFTNFDEPESFTKGVELLEDDRDIRGKIGNYESYSYFEKDLPKKEDNPASFKVSLKGSAATIYISCKVKKDISGQWHLVEFKQDSLKK